MARSVKDSFYLDTDHQVSDYLLNGSADAEMLASDPIYAHDRALRFRTAVAVAIVLLGLLAVLFASGDAARLAEFGDGRVAHVTTTILEFAHYPIVLTLIPLLAGPLAAELGKRRSEHSRDLILLTTYVASGALIIIMSPQVFAGAVETSIPGVLGFGLHFRVDLVSYVMVLSAGLLWFVVGIYARDYMMTEHHRDRFAMFLAVTYAGVLGTVMAADILTMFLFFELTTFSSYMLVAHHESSDSLVAGNNYIYMGVIGGLSILVGIVLMQFYTEKLDFVLLAQELRDIGIMQYVIATLFVLGFGLKAGMMPLHIWLPKAHPVAPTPASALLSGLLIKTGTYGMLRVMTSFFMPGFRFAASREDVLWSLSHNEGTVLIWIGIATMAAGVVMALQQSSMKKMLAYHSISQMGYIIMGVGVASYLGYIGAMGFAGSIYHTVNHALFKSLLFMVVGVLYLYTGESNMYRLGDLWRRMPFTALVCLVASLGITGMPGFNGFASKSILHHAIDEAWHYGHHSFRTAETLFTVVSAGTVCSFIKLYYYAFLRKRDNGAVPLSVSRIGSGTMQIAMAVLATLIVLIGAFPSYLLDTFIIPAARTFNYDPSFIDRYLVGITFFNPKEIWNAAVVYLLGAALFATGIRFGLFHLHAPRGLTVENAIYRPIYRAVRGGADKLTYNYEHKTNTSDVYIYAAVLVFALASLLLIGTA